MELFSEFSRHLRFELVAAGEGHAHLRAAVRPEYLNLHGTAHGSFLCALADEAFALASNSRGVPAVALSIHMDYFRPVAAGDIVEALAAEEHLGRRTATYRVEVRRASELVALFTGTAARATSPEGAGRQG